MERKITFNRNKSEVVTVRYLSLGIFVIILFVILLISGETALADEGLAGFGRIAEPPSPENPQAPTWGPVPTEKISLANLAPVLLPYFNNAPVFGLPGTVVGNFWYNTQLTSDWGGLRTDLARHGVFLDVYSTSAYQYTSCGLKAGSAFVQNIQISMNVDTGRAGLWPGGLFHFTVESRYGSSPENTFTVGSTAPQYYGLALPGPFFANDTYPTEYYLVQSLPQKFSVILGKLNVLYLADQTLFGDSYKYYFANFSFNKNPAALNFFNTTSLAAVGVWSPTDWVTFAGGVFDPNSQANNLATHAFDSVNLYGVAILSYKVGDLPGRFMPQFNWTNKSKIDLGSPFGQLSQAQIPQAVGVLLGSSSTEGLPINFKSQSWGTIANFSQYLFVMEDSAAITQKLKSGQPLNGIGVFGRFGYAPPETNTVTLDGSVALVAYGLIDFRKYDSFGVGFYYNAISHNLKDSINQLTAGTATVEDEKGIEIFYDFAITPAIRLIPSYQHIWDPLSARVSKNQSRADVFLVRLNVAF